MTDLPKHRVNMIRPFTHVGVDYTGHIFCKDGNKEVKMYLLIFTCLNVKACHLVLIPERSTNHFILPLIMFWNVYGIHSTIYSENAKSFISEYTSQKTYLLQEISRRALEFIISSILKPYVETNLLIKIPTDDLPSFMGHKILVKSLEIRDDLLDKFKEQWYEEYL